jgi:hypothetical protein
MGSGTGMNSRVLQELLNKFRKARTPELAAIPVSGRWDQTTSDALRCFQHEHNTFNGARVLIENGELNVATKTAIDWWSEVLHQVV